MDDAPIGLDTPLPAIPHPLRTRRRRPFMRRQRLRLLSSFSLALVALALLFRAHPFTKDLPMNPFPTPPPLPLPYPYYASPNCDDRPPGVVVSCVVVHSTVLDTLDATIQTFLDPAKKVSAHFVVDRDGRVVQMVPVEQRAWHAGVSVLDGVPHVNDFSIGIEMVNRNDGVDPYPDAQYEAVAGIIRFLRSRYFLPDSRIVSHAAIALPPGRKSDPLGFDFARLCALAR